MKDECLTVDEVAARIGKAPETVRRWIAAGTIAAVKDGYHVMIPAAALAPFQSRPCALCGAAFTPSRPNRGGRYCSTACADAARYRRNHPETPTPPPDKPKGPAAVDPRIRKALKLIRQ
ncbi:MAG: helix-turn-helix domain-containing protein [bacterium]